MTMSSVATTVKSLNVGRKDVIIGLEKVEEIAGHFGSVLRLLGLDTTDPSLSKTPERIAKMLLSFTTPFDAKAILSTEFDTVKEPQLVAQTGIPFDMLCEHHFMPAIGTARIAYIPDEGRVVGLSKLARLVHCVGHERPSLQESINARIADLIQEHMRPKGCIVILQAEHTCMTCRGVHTPGVATSTSIIKGLFRDNPYAKQEALSLLGF